MSFKYDEPLDYFNHFWNKYEKFKSQYLKKNKVFLIPIERSQKENNKNKNVIKSIIKF